MDDFRPIGALVQKYKLLAFRQVGDACENIPTVEDGLKILTMTDYFKTNAAQIF